MVVYLQNIDIVNKFVGKTPIPMGNIGIKLKIISAEEYVKLNCSNFCDLSNDCVWMRFAELSRGNTRDVYVSFCVVEVLNLKSDKINIEYSNFTVIDKNGYSQKGLDFRCKIYGNERDAVVHEQILYPMSKVRFLLVSKAKTIGSVVYDSRRGYNDMEHEYDLVSIHDSKSIDNSEEYYLSKILEKDKEIMSLKDKIKEYETKIQDMDSKLKSHEKTLKNKDREIKSLEEDIEGYIEDYENLKESGGARFGKDMLCRYEIVEDDDYLRIISLEDEDTVSFNREFDKSKSNYNWINKGDALISLRSDNSFGFSLEGRTMIKSLVSGIFEFEKNKLIGFKEEICRVKKYDQSEKEEIISLLEAEEIKNNVYKKERKKMLERQALDELIEEGKVYNVYTKKDGNRTTIPQDVANAVWNRDGGRCCYCGSKENLEFDHIIPISKGGATTFRNLQLLCKNCNIKKSDNI